VWNLLQYFWVCFGEDVMNLVDLEVEKTAFDT